MKLEPNMYIRTKEGKIFKFVKIENKQYRRTWVSDNETITTAFELEDVAKASYNIIDLIEVGDFISYIYPSGLGILGFEDVKVTEGLLNILQNGENNHEYTIKSIVTKEMFSQMEYKIGGND